MLSRALNKFYVLLVILYVTQLINFLHSEIIINAIFYSAVIIGFISMILCFISPYKNVSPVAYIIAVFALLLPLFCAWRSHVVFGQPIFYGIAKMRFMFILLFAFHLYYTNYPLKTLIKQINYVNILIAAASSVALYVFKIDNVVAEQYFFSTYSVESEAVSDAIKGVKLTYCSYLIIVSTIYYLIKSVRHPNPKNISILLLFMFYTLFVHKGRQPLVAIGAVFMVHILANLNFRNIAIGIAALCSIAAVIANDSSIINRYATILDGEYSMDTSILARLSEVEYVMPYIQKYPIAGFGQLSQHFNDGFHGIFDKYFYLDDIGFIGTMAKGGIILLIMCVVFYYLCLKYTYLIKDDDTRSFIRGMLIALIVLSFIGSEALTNSPSMLIFLIYPMIYAPVKKKFNESFLQFRL